jgi:two-component system chemotaxis response regulator CheY
MMNLNTGIAREFLADCSDHLFTLEKELLALENGGGQIDATSANRAIKVVHSVRGGAYFLDLAKIGELAHQTEDSLTLLSSGRMAATPERVDVLLHATDRLRELLLDPGTSNQADISDVLSALAMLPHSTVPEPAVIASSKAFQPESGARKLRTLLVEDDFTSRLLLQTFLSRYGDCHVAVNGREAVDAFRLAAEQGLTYDLICMDIMMPEMDGPEAVRRIRLIEEARGIGLARGAKITMTTTVGDIKKVFQCFKELCDAYLVKPIDLTKLIGHMKNWEMIQ